MIEIVDSEGRILGLLDQRAHPLGAPKHGQHVRVPLEQPTLGRPTDMATILEIRWHCVNIGGGGVSSVERWYLVAPNGVLEDAWKDVGLIDLRKEWKR